MSSLADDAYVQFIRDEFRDLRAKFEDLDRRQTNAIREATVTKLHEKEGMVEVEADGLPSQKVPWTTRAGTSREWDPPTVGERVILKSVNGEPGLGVVERGGFSNKFPQNHDKAGEHRRSVGDKVSTTTTEKDKVSKTEKVTVSQEAGSHTIVAENTTSHRVEGGKITNDTNVMIATRNVHLATG